METEKKTTAVELFLDLVFVYAVTRTSELVQEDHTWLGVLRAVIVFVPVFWLWVGTTMHADLHDVDTWRGRPVVFLVAACGLVMSLALPGAWEHHALMFALAYWAGRLVLMASILRSPDRRSFVTFPVGAFLTGPLLVVGALLGEHLQLALWALVAVVDLAVPLVLRNRVVKTPFHVEHLAGRYSTFVIIAVGETIVATAAAAGEGPLTGLRLGTMGISFLVICCLWWTYFDLAAPAIEHGLHDADVAIDVIRPVLSYGHLAFTLGIIGIAAAVGDAVAEPAEHLHPDIAALLFGGAALYLATFGFTRRQLGKGLAVPRLSGAFACAVLAVLAPAMPAVWSLVLLAVVQFGVIAGDSLRERRHPTA